MGPGVRKPRSTLIMYEVGGTRVDSVDTTGIAVHTLPELADMETLVCQSGSSSGRAWHSGSQPCTTLFKVTNVVKFNLLMLASESTLSIKAKLSICESRLCSLLATTDFKKLAFIELGLVQEVFIKGEKQHHLKTYSNFFMKRNNITEGLLL